VRREKHARTLLGATAHIRFYERPVSLKLAVRPESLFEWAALKLGLVPVPLFETHISATLARAIMAGVSLGIFDCLAAKPLAAVEVAKQCDTDAAATALLLDALVACDYLNLKSRHYALAPKSRKWLVGSSAKSVRDKILLQATEWNWLAHLEDFIRSGKPLDFHATMSDTERNLYHRSMRAIAGIAGREVAWRTPVPPHARRMLDLGGSHGHFAASICRRHPQLQAEILDLPPAIAKAAPLLVAEKLGDRVVHVAGDVTTADLGSQRYDLVFMSNLAHHLDEPENRSLAQRVARALRPGGIFVLQEAIRPKRASQTGGLLGLYFALQSRPDVTTWKVSDLRSWQADAGLTPRKAKRLYTAPGWVQQSAQL
jgi:SAM-dependent methyltransferase